MSVAPLRKVGKLDVPAAALAHPFARECLRAIATLRTETANVVVGTSNGKAKAQLYGWKRGVPPHKDDTGIVYFAPLKLPPHGSLVMAGEHRELVEVGGVYELDDRVKHSTHERQGTVLALFVGPYPIRQPGKAVTAMREGLQQLADPECWEAPRVVEGFRAGPLRGECWAWDYHDAVMARRRDLKARGLAELRCHCGRPAAKLDTMFPYFTDGNRCRSCAA